ncbi:MAG: FMN-binding protein, partial [Youngiibacter sp.]|nr:FMN-binding protein [Youngiibacter sp.]
MKKFRKILSLVLVGLMIAGLAACGTKTPTTPTVTATFKAGTYDGEADGFHGKIKVKVTVTDTAITDIKVEHTETEGLGDKAVEEIVAMVKANTSLKVDAVT